MIIVIMTESDGEVDKHIETGRHTERQGQRDGGKKAQPARQVDIVEQ